MPKLLSATLMRKGLRTVTTRELSTRAGPVEVAPPSSGRWRTAARTIIKTSAGVGVLAGLGLTWAYVGGRAELEELGDEGLPLNYDPAAIRAFWDAHPRVVVWRLCELFKTTLPFLRSVLVDYKQGKLESDEAQRIKAVEFKNLLTELGPTFIKFGQMLSTRPDLLPQAALLELQKLCDAVPSFPTPLARQIIRTELGEEGLAAFPDLRDETLPIAAASLGQVYKLRLKDGREVAVKVQRPDMIRSVSLDLYIIRLYSECLEASKSLLMKLGILTPRKQFDVDLVDCFARGSYKELDYENEARNQEYFAKELVPRMNGCVRIPDVVWSLTSRKVIVSEWINGKQLVQCDAATIKRLTPIGVECFLKQILEIAVSHGDPHAGNLLVDEKGTLVLIDFGLCVEVPRPDMKVMTGAILHLMQGDVPGLIDDAVELGFLPTDVDRQAVLVDLQRVLEDSKVKASDLISGRYKAIEGRRRKFKEVSRELNAVFFKHPFVVPEYFALLTRALIVLEGIAVVGDPEFDIFSSAYPYAMRRGAQVFDRKDLMDLLRETGSTYTLWSALRAWIPFL
ncbi:Protein ACTIVITY OF BC1 COMPLEX KINASE 3, chloroplastic [Hondaea fermentalgiana]|uniref:Protein ACTIVITY OF BC1 COMPLEX KINASE 3, chloroplastic n=1 Tax=Hondaea fermentalgiana TaxID=2315210 RepID=A0A2R5GEX6_9STRA|nr:Protein ACTIVITY OF BC1 COMPLEX KINASE 3, chloroplastic [Hondaea fermentalgiana]|eukprot:GBG26384.1 Protein ACTIVITY OF BC1 COMPLEX KINASE 3, chloroplastic [Hondaea fermentalgiana]